MNAKNLLEFNYTFHIDLFKIYTILKEENSYNISCNMISLFEWEAKLTKYKQIHFSTGRTWIILR